MADQTISTEFKEVLRGEITKDLLPDNGFLSKSNNDSKWVENDVVHKPQRTDALPGIEINREVIPATVTQRVYGNKDLTLNEFSGDPVAITVNEQKLTNVNLRKTLAEDQANSLNQKFADYTLQVWPTTGAANLNAGAFSQTLTTGASRAVDISEITGTRKAITKADILRIMKKMDRDNVPMTGRQALVTPQQAEDMVLIDGFVKADELGISKSNLIDGFVGRIAGFDFIKRSRVGFYNAAGQDLRVLDEAIQVTDSEFALFWHPRFVSHALGSTQSFFTKGDPTVYGDIYSFVARFGAMRERLDMAGVVSLIEAT